MNALQLWLVLYLNLSAAPQQIVAHAVSDVVGLAVINRIDHLSISWMLMSDVAMM